LHGKPFIALQQALMLGRRPFEKQAQRFTVSAITALAQPICYGQNTGFLYLFFASSPATQ
jgi:hypothetical protein